MIRSNFLSPEDRRELLSCVKRQREDHGIARRANALLLLDDGKSCVEVARVLYLDDDTVRGWHKQYLAEGWDAVAYDGWKGGQSRMTVAQEAALCVWLEGRFCRSTVEIRAHIAAQIDLHYSHLGCVKLLSRLGFEYRKPKATPRVADVAKQAKFIAFYENLLNSLGADEAVYFADAVHPEYQSKPDCTIRSRIGPTVHEDIISFGRKRNPFNHMTVCYRKDLALKCGGYPDLPYMEDFGLWINMLSSGAKAMNDSRVFVKARIGNGMVRRRGGVQYVQSEIKLQLLMLRTGFKSRTEAVLNGLMRSIVFIMPTSLRKVIYSRLLRRAR